MKVETALEVGQRAAAQSDLTGLAIVEEIGRRIETGDRLNAARHLVDGVRGLRIARVAGCPLHQREVPARRSARDADAVGVDLKVLGMIPDVADRPVHVLEDLRNRELGLAAMHDREDGVAAAQQLIDGPRIDRVVPRERGSMITQIIAAPLGMAPGVKMFDRQGRAIFAAVHHVDLAVERRIVIAAP